MLFPVPDGPMIAAASPGASEKWTFERIVSIPPGVAYCFPRLATSSFKAELSPGREVLVSYLPAIYLRIVWRKNDLCFRPYTFVQKPKWSKNMAVASQRRTIRFAIAMGACCALSALGFLGAQSAPPRETGRLSDRRIVRTVPDRLPQMLPPARAAGSWPSFRGSEASGVAEGQNLPDKWNVRSGENILWRTTIPGLAHSSPVVWGDRLFVTSAVSSNPAATFRPGLYGDGDASDDRSRQRWMVYALDKRTGKILWERVAYEGQPIDKRHIKSTYASATPATDGRIVVAWFGSQGVFAYDMNGNLRWKVDLGRLDVGAYDIPSFEWGPASSPIIWNDLVILQCDTQADSFVIALNVQSGETVWKTSTGGTALVGHSHGGDDICRGDACHQRVEFYSRVRPPDRKGTVETRRELEDHGTDACF